LLGDAAVCRPARMSEPVRGAGTVRPRGGDEVLEVADRADVVEPVLLAERETRGVVAAILEPAEPLQEERLGLARPHVSDDPAHGFPPERERARLLDRSASSRNGQPSSSRTSAAILAQRASDSASDAASARIRTTGSVPDGRTRTRALPFSWRFTCSS